METPEPTEDEPDILEEHLDSLIDLDKKSDSLLEVEISLMRRPEPAIEQKLQVREPPSLDAYFC